VTGKVHAALCAPFMLQCDIAIASVLTNDDARVIEKN
jgi:hypothetical protein